MKKHIKLLTALVIGLFAGTNAMAKNDFDTIMLNMPVGIGKNAAGISFSNNQYYTVLAGGSDHLVVIFDETKAATFMSTTGFDVRGIWYNPKSKQFEGNAYGGSGIKVMISADVLLESIQPDSKSGGTLDTTENEILYYYRNRIYRQHRETGASLGSIEISGLPSEASMNTTAIAYTGIPKKEIALLNQQEKVILLINKSNGKVNEKIKLPEYAVTSKEYNFDYANGYFWLYDSNIRKWTGFKIKE